MSAAGSTYDEIRAGLRCGNSGCPCAKPNGLLHCPAHDDHKPGLSLSLKNGKIIWHCFPGCSQEAVTNALIVRGLWDPPAASRPAPVRRRIVATYSYTDEAGALLYQAVRYEPKSFSQRRPDGDGGWVWSLGSVRRVLYHLPDVRAAVAAGRLIFLPEGEKDTDNVRSLGLDATTNAGGAKYWRPEYSQQLEGADVVLLPDNDASGAKSVEIKGAPLTHTARSVRVLALPGLGPKGDVSDWISAGGTGADVSAMREDLLRLAAEAPLYVPPPDSPEARPMEEPKEEEDVPPDPLGDYLRHNDEQREKMRRRGVRRGGLVEKALAAAREEGIPESFAGEIAEGLVIGWNLNHREQAKRRDTVIEVGRWYDGLSNAHNIKPLIISQLFQIDLWYVTGKGDRIYHPAIQKKMREFQSYARLWGAFGDAISGADAPPVWFYDEILPLPTQPEDKNRQAFYILEWQEGRRAGIRDKIREEKRRLAREKAARSEHAENIRLKTLHEDSDSADDFEPSQTEVLLLKTVRAQAAVEGITPDELLMLLVEMLAERVQKHPHADVLSDEQPICSAPGEMGQTRLHLEDVRAVREHSPVFHSATAEERSAPPSRPSVTPAETETALRASPAAPPTCDGLGWPIGAGAPRPMPGADAPSLSTEQAAATDLSLSSPAQRVLDLVAAGTSEKQILSTILIRDGYSEYEIGRSIMELEQQKLLWYRKDGGRVFYVATAPDPPDPLAMDILQEAPP